MTPGSSRRRSARRAPSWPSVGRPCTGQASNAFLGPSARPSRDADDAGGFCLFSNVAIGARRCAGYGGVKPCRDPRDFDVHRWPRAAKATVEVDPSLFYGSTRNRPSIPAPAHRERGVDNNVINVPLSMMANSSSTEFRAAWGDRILPLSTFSALA